MTDGYTRGIEGITKDENIRKSDSDTISSIDFKKEGILDSENINTNEG